ncbi:MAG: ABC transporter permease subunit [Streptosporangiales bacterium]|nr:ABC transporter permease subunit [Streptosporangiales bacterium]
MSALDLGPRDVQVPLEDLTFKVKRRSLPWVTLLIVGFFIFVGLFAPLLTSYSPTAPDLINRLQPPSAEHWLGTDSLGRDMVTRLFHGARITLTVVTFALLMGSGVGLVLGMVAGYFGGAVDAVISRIVDAVLSIPGLFFGLLFAATLGTGIKSVVFAISLILWSRFARVIRSEVRSIRERDFVSQSRVIGCSRLRTIVVHVFPNVLSTIMVLVSINLGEVILLEAALSFLGAGIPPPNPSWGAMIAEGQRYLTTAWWMALTPGVAILLAVLSVNLLGDWVRERLDPRLRDKV